MFLYSILPRSDRRGRELKLALIVLSFSVTGLSAVYYQIYPLSLIDGIGYLQQVPILFWVFIGCALGSLFFIAILSKSPLVTLGSVVVTALVLNFHYFLIYGVNGRDMRGEVSRLFFTLDEAHLSVDMYSYFQWPVHFLTIQQLDRILSLPLTDTIWMGYIAYYCLFAVGVGFFAHSFSEAGSFTTFAGAAFYLIFTRQWLNNQLVPQFFALIILLFLFSIRNGRDRRSRLLRALLYLVLILSHPLIFIFYLLYVLTLPTVRAVLDTIDETGSAHRWFVFQVFGALQHAPTSAITLHQNLRRRFDTSWLYYLIVLVATYLAFLYARFTLFSERLIFLLLGPMNESSSSKIPQRLLELLFGTNSTLGGGPGRAFETVLLYEMVPGFEKDITLFGTVAIILALLLVSVIALLSKPTARISPTSIAITLGGGIYYLAGFVLPIIGTRAFQVFLIPLGTFLDGGSDYKRYLKVVVLVLLVASPIIVANFMINYSLTGGGNTHDFHADQAGLFLLDHSNLKEGVITYPAAGFPPGVTREGEDLPTKTIEAIIVRGATSSEMIVYGPRQEYRAAYFNHRCNFNPAKRNAIYDNKIQVLRDSIVSQSLVCTRR